MAERSVGGARAASTGGARSTTWASYAACAWAFAFAAAHVYWGLGGRAGLPVGVPMTGALFVVNLVAIPLCLVSALLALALVRPWGRLIPRWMLLAAAWGACALLVLRGGVGLVQLLGSALEQVPLLIVLAEPRFLVGGILFGMAAWGYQRRAPAPRDGLI